MRLKEVMKEIVRVDKDLVLNDMLLLNLLSWDVSNHIKNEPTKTKLLMVLAECIEELGESDMPLVCTVLDSSTTE